MLDCSSRGARFLLVAIFALILPSSGSAEVSWLDGNPNAIWMRSPGFYKENGVWYAILHVKPSVTRVRLVVDLTGGGAATIDLNQTPDAKFWWFKGTDSDFGQPLRAGDTYRFILNEGTGPDQYRQDPAARRVQNSGLSSRSIVTLSDDYQWQDQGWNRPQWYRHIVYQLHPLRFTDRSPGLNPFQQITEELNNSGTRDYLNSLGVTAIQLLPVNEFPMDHSWGYNPSFFYAVESAYGSPDDLKRLVDTAHQQGIAVFFDVVYNHGGSGDNILWQIAQTAIHDGTYYDGDTVWGPMINFDNDVARHFFTQNIAYLLREYHIDGFRFDFTRPIHLPDSNIREPGSGGGWDFLRAIRASAKAIDPGIVLIAEELPNDWWVTREQIPGSSGDPHGPFDAQWADVFHDNFKWVLTNNGSHLDALYGVFTEFGDSWQDGLIYTESHDEVGNTDDRIGKRGRDGKGWEMSQLAASGTLLGRGIPMIFMGQEAGETMQFGQDDGRLSQYNPGTGTTWWDDRLPLDAYENDPNRAKVVDWYKRMVELRKADARTLSLSPIAVAYIHNDNGIAAFSRNNGEYVVVLNFKGRNWPSYNIGITGRYREVANTSWRQFNLGGYTERSRGGSQADNISDVPIPAYGAVVLKRE